MLPTRRERIREATFEEIKVTAWKQIADQGVASLSLRAIAREMGMTAPGLYRYYTSRDDLVTALIIAAFNSFSDALEEARDKQGRDDHAGRFRAICRAYFNWAVADPQKYSLIFGTPIPGYVFHQEAGPAAQRAFLILQGVIGEAHAAGKITGELAALRLPAGLRSQYEALGKMGMPYSPGVTHLALSIWGSIHGITSLYLYGYLAGFLADQVEAFLGLEIEKMVRLLGLS
jgi:AcrR family transcriptional regulator